MFRRSLVQFMEASLREGSNSRDGIPCLRDADGSASALSPGLGQVIFMSGYSISEPDRRIFTEPIFVRLPQFPRGQIPIIDPVFHKLLAVGNEEQWVEIGVKDLRHFEGMHGVILLARGMPTG